MQEEGGACDLYDAGNKILCHRRVGWEKESLRILQLGYVVLAQALIGAINLVAAAISAMSLGRKNQETVLKTRSLWKMLMGRGRERWSTSRQIGEYL